MQGMKYRVSLDDDLLAHFEAEPEQVYEAAQSLVQRALGDVMVCDYGDVKDLWPQVFSRDAVVLIDRD